MASSQMKPRNIAPLTTTAFLAFPHSRHGRRRRRPTGAAILVIAQIVFASPDRRSTFEANRRGNTRGRSATADRTRGNQRWSESWSAAFQVGMAGHKKWRACIRSTSYNFSTSIHPLRWAAAGVRSALGSLASSCIHPRPHSLGALGAAESCS